jgi:hypothetical protein
LFDWQLVVEFFTALTATYWLTILNSWTRMTGGIDLDGS